MTIAERDLLDGADTADPRKPQKRYATTPSGRGVWIDVTGDDRLKLIKRLPSRWPEVVMARERGETLEQICRWAHVPPPCQPECRYSDTAASTDSLVRDRVHLAEPCIREHLAGIYAWFETELHDLASRRAKLMV